jgi:hypothetical protein
MFYKDALRPVLAFDPIAKCDLHRIKQPLIEKFLTARLAEGVAVVTANHSVRALRRALHIAATNFELIPTPPKLSTRQDEHVRDAVVDEPDFQRLLKACEIPAEKIAGAIHRPLRLRSEGG